MNRRWILFLSSLVLGAGLLAGSTLAWFSGWAETSPNLFTAGTLIIGAPSAGVNTGNMSLANAAPGDVREHTILVQNLGTMPFWYKVTAIPGENSEELFDELLVSVNGSITDMPLTSLQNVVLNTELAAGEDESVTFVLRMPNTVGNGLMGKMAVVDFIFDAAQIEPENGNGTPIEGGPVNFGFEEGTLNGWEIVTQTQNITVTGPDGKASPRWGDYMVRLGSWSTPQPSGDNKIRQQFVANKDTLTFAYNIFTLDADRDHFSYEVSVVGPGGQTIAQYSTTAFGHPSDRGIERSTGWQEIILPISGYLGETLSVTVNAGGGGGGPSLNQPTWAYFDAP